MSGEPLVTVLIDTFNHEGFIERAIQSVLDQTCDMSQVEVIVVDDGSTDATSAKLAAFGDKIQVLRKPNGGQASAFNHGIAQARGKYLATLDGDDWWREDKLAQVLAVMGADEEVGFVGHAIMETDGHGKERLVAPAGRVEFRFDGAAGAGCFVKHRCFMGTSRMAGRTELFKRLLPVPEALVVEADEYFFTLAPALMKAVILPEPLCFYRLHGGNLYQFAGYDPKRLRTKSRVHSCLAETIPAWLDKLQVAPEARAVVLDPVMTEARRLKLAAFGGWPGSALGVEWHLWQQQRAAGEAGKLWVKLLMLCLAAVMPGAAFYRFRAWWGRARRQALA